METYSVLGLDSSGKEVSGTPPVLSLLASALERSIRKTEKVPKKKGDITIFHGLRAPTLSIRQYTERIYRYARCSPSCFVVAYIYMEKFLQRTNGYLTLFNIHRLLITSVMVAAKFIDDTGFNNAYFAKVGGVSTAEMNRLELKFLFDLDFRLHVSPETFSMYCLQLEKEDGGIEQIERLIPIRGMRSGSRQK